MNTTTKRNTRRLRSQLLLTLFILALVSLTALFTRGISSSIVRTLDDMSDWSPGYICISIERGDRIQITDNKTTNWANAFGYVCAPTTRGSELSRFSSEYHVPEDRGIEQGLAARNIVTTWINRRHVQLLPVEGELTLDEEGEYTAYLACAMVDVGRKLLMDGHAIALDVPHPKRDEYLAFQKEAQEKGLGLWRE